MMIRLFSARSARLSFAAYCAAAFALGGVLAGAGAAWAADTARGRIISARWCAACHVVTDDQKQASVDAPSFGDIARRRTEPKPLAVFLSEPHGMMPDMSLTQIEIADIVAYIRSLAPGGDPSPAPRKPPDSPKNG